MFLIFALARHCKLRRFRAAHLTLRCIDHDRDAMIGLLDARDHAMRPADAAAAAAFLIVLGLPLAPASAQDAARLPDWKGNGSGSDR